MFRGVFSMRKTRNRTEWFEGLASQTVIAETWGTVSCSKRSVIGQWNSRVWWNSEVWLPLPESGDAFWTEWHLGLEKRARTAARLDGMREKKRKPWLRGSLREKWQSQLRGQKWTASSFTRKRKEKILCILKKICAIQQCKQVPFLNNEEESATSFKSKIKSWFRLILRLIKFRQQDKHRKHKIHKVTRAFALNDTLR